MAAIVGIHRRDFTIKACHRNQPNKSTLTANKTVVHKQQDGTLQLFRRIWCDVYQGL